MIKFRNITYPVVSAIECKAAQLIAFALGYKWDCTPGVQTEVKNVATLKWLGFDPDTKTIRVYDRDYATHKDFDQAINLNQLTEKLSNPYKLPPIAVNLENGRPFAIVIFTYPNRDNRTATYSERYVRMQSMDDDYLTGYEIPNAESDEPGKFKRFLVDKMLGEVVVLRQDT